MLQNNDKLKLIITLVVAIVITSAPCLQAWHIGVGSDTCSGSCCCCECSSEQGEAEPVELPLLESARCCDVSTPTTETDIPFEAQLFPTSNQDLLTSEKLTAPRVTIVEIESYHIIQTDYRSVPGSPLYILNESFII